MQKGICWLWRVCQNAGASSSQGNVGEHTEEARSDTLDNQKLAHAHIFDQHIWMQAHL
jgi:hypothetical protein